MRSSRSTTQNHPKISKMRVARLSKLAKKIDREEGSAIKARGREVFRRHELIQKVISELKAARKAKGLSLKEVGQRSGIGKANLSRMENDLSPNPTWDTISRYAESIGRQLKVSLQ